MKIFKYICLSALFALGISSCSDYLDINNNPDNPNSTIPSASLRLRAIQANFVDAYESSGTRGCWITGNIAKTGGTTYNDQIIQWRPNVNSCTWPYQSWFIYTASNIPDLLDKAEAEEAWHYIGAAQLIHAWGFMTMLDVYGEMPYTEALTSSITPKYDDGKTIYEGCMAMLDKAIENFQKEQPTTAESLADGDIWNGGDTKKWLKLAYGLKARWMLNTSKKADFDPQAVLDVLAKAADSNADGTIMHYQNSNLEQESGLKALQFGNVTNTTSRVTKWYLDLLTNTFTDGSGVEDPRTDLLVPSGQFMNKDGKLEYRRTAGIDLYSNIRNAGGPVTFDVFSSNTQTAIKFLDGVNLDPVRDIWASGTTDPARKGDSIYIPIYSEHLSWITASPGDPKDDRYIANRYNGKSERIISTGTFYTRADAPGHLLCYPEVCFMKAECYFRLGQKGQALQEYKKGIRAHMELMNEKLKDYDQTVYGKQIIPAKKIDAFLASNAVAQSEAELTMAKIMQQKFVACSFSIQNWNDMRRFNYGAGNIKDFGVVYVDFGRPKEFDAESGRHYTSDNPSDARYWFRRFQQASLESSYNINNLKESNKEALELTINSCPVWWDCASDEEYYSYIK
ncbi:SusD/RagB family nutrient-binding outer membrane lipoprotein [uncultured Bacteroides sp.]|uniref:SusD/RagB family nutrient-binding outer membrane lipoprotein n=1 Tax=uncultured Bacteroides sp. TaxID=162156 RepID=UPI0025F9F704|nr:SusD/RagB family nutrient-binding outer membrane lipoprotein [uncultured Bacteroides sp.]